MKTFKEFSDICESIAGALPNKPTIAPPKAPSKVSSNIRGPVGQAVLRPVGFKPQKPSLIGQIGRLANTPVGRFAMNNVLRRMPHVKAASVVNAGPVADGTLDAARQKGYLK